tara:strand:- start:286 stop:516 length:231 start_codon:yes stop_codon:yes gene_type:complete
MRFLEFNKGPGIVITNEEQAVILKVRKEGSCPKKKFSEREVHIANQLVNKDILLRKKINDQFFYTPQARTGNYVTS